MNNIEKLVSSLIGGDSAKPDWGAIEEAAVVLSEQAAIIDRLQWSVVGTAGEGLEHIRYCVDCGSVQGSDEHDDDCTILAALGGDDDLPTDG